MAENTLHLASKKRRLLSLYIDFLLFMTLWGILSYYLAPDGNMPFWLPYIAFVVARTLLTKFYGSIGDSFLSIDRDSFCVDDDIYRRENWLSILLGLLFILEGTKQLVRWTQMFVAAVVLCCGLLFLSPNAMCTTTKVGNLYMITVAI